MAQTDHKKSRQPDSGILVVSQSRPTKANCWSCGAMRAAHFCQECGKVQPPAPVDYFTFFGLPFKLNLEPAKLEREFYALSRHLHPDINAVNSDREQQWSLEKSSQLNDAYRTLKDPITRTEYLLRLQGVQTGRAVQGGNRRGAPHRQAQEAGGSARSAGRGLRAEHAARRDADEQEDGRARPQSRARAAGRQEALAGQSTTACWRSCTRPGTSGTR